MRFIRDIIFEKRGTRMAAPPVQAVDEIDTPSAVIDDPWSEAELNAFGQDLDAVEPAALPDDADLDMPEPAAASPAVMTFPEADAPGETPVDAPAFDSAPQPVTGMAGREDAARDTDFAALFETDEEDSAMLDAPALDAIEPLLLRRAAPVERAMAETSRQAAPIAVAPSQTPAPEVEDLPFVSVEAALDGAIQVPPPAAGRGSNRSGRVKTRLLGFTPEAYAMADPIERAEARESAAFPVGWLVVVAGPGRGAAFALQDGVSRVGRGEDQAVSLNFGDNSISRENHLSVAYDSEQNAFYIGQSGRANLVRLNNRPVLSTEQLRTGDQIRVGETTLRFVALCDEAFSWSENPSPHARHA